MSDKQPALNPLLMIHTLLAGSQLDQERQLRDRVEAHRSRPTNKILSKKERTMLRYKESKQNRGKA